MHCAFLNINDTKISKSLGNIVTVRELVAKHFSPLSLRYFFLQSHYRSQTNFTWEALMSAETAYKKMRAAYRALPATGGTPITACVQSFTEAINDDLHTPQALADAWNVIHSKKRPEDIRATLDRFDTVLGLQLAEKEKEVVIPGAVTEALALRETARAEKNWGASDELRNKIRDLGFTVKDTEAGPQLEPVEK